MSDCCNSKLCDKSIKFKTKKDYLISLYHQGLKKSIVCRCYIKHSDFF